MLLIDGAGYLLVDNFNRPEFNKGTKETLAIGGAMTGLEVIFRLLIPNKIRLKGRTNLRIPKV